MPTISRDAIALAYDVAGAGAAVLLLHGAWMSRGVWATTQRALAGAYRTIALDQRGHGGSGAVAQPWSLDDLAADALAVLDAEGVGACAVVGHSMGGVVAQVLAARHPARVRALVLVETTYGTRTTALDAWGTQLALALVRAAPHWVLRQSVAQHGQHHPATRAQLEAGVAAFANDPRRALWALHATFAFDGRAALPTLTMPALVVVGQQHRQTHAQAHTMAAQLPHAALHVVPGAGHVPMTDNAAAFHDVLLRFLATAMADA